MANATTKSSSVNAGIKQRPPIVVVMGHVDHGKTTLLDYIRKANIAAHEAGGITQAVGAYEIEHNGRKITFIDTPGHEAFMSMRSRGAQAADLAILVVAADEGVKPQTKESIRIIEETKTPFIVAFNKIDKTGGAIDKARNDLMAADILLEGFGGQVSYHGVSAKTGEGVPDLLDLVVLAADVEDLKYDASAPASGYILEARRDPRRGIEATVIVKNGILHRGDPVKTASAAGKVKILENFLEKPVLQLEPSAPAVIIGFESLPAVGEVFGVGELGTGTSAYAGDVAVKSPAAGAGRLGEAKANTLNLILKSSDSGSLEALSIVLRNVDQSGGKEVNVVEEAVGDITDGDVKHAVATGSTIIGFKNKVTGGARTLAEAQEVTIITSNIVYDLEKAVEEFLTGARGPAALGELEVLAVFNQEKLEKQLVGGRVLSGVVRAKTSFEVVRQSGAEAPKQQFGHGRILELRERKSEITQAEKGKEIGLLVNTHTAIKVGDKLVIRK
ncbi:MAG TPA: translation initiation factor IF-2 [Candidatus Paceibacterota bacterium]|nr:translation initiation factor IF-2 [Candidatus Paceibacterota bacterium]